MDAGGGEPEREYEEHRARGIDLGLGAASVLLPEHWRIETQDLTEVTVAVAEISGATFSAKLTCYEDPEAIRANDLAHYLNHPAARPFSAASLDKVRDERGEPDYEALTVHFGCTEYDSQATTVTGDLDIWRRLRLLRSGRIRVVEFNFHTPPEGVDKDFRRDMMETLRAVIDETSFASEPTKFDLVAPTAGLKLSPLWDCIYVRVPEAWERERENPDGTGMYVFDDKENDRWTLWIDYDSYSRTDGENETPPDVDEFARSLLRGARDRDRTISADIVPLPDRPGEAMVKTVYSSVEDDIPLSHTSWHKVAATGTGITLGHFTWVVPERHLEDDDIRALTGLVEREVCNALLIAPGRRDDGDDPAGG